MPSYWFSTKDKAYVKQCSHCKIITVGVADAEESLKIFLTVFSASTGSGMADGMQSRCWICNASKRRSLGVTRPILEKMFEDQNGQCAICDKELSIERNAGSTVHANVDHDEATGNVRGILCGHCNRGIGSFDHNPEILNKAARYLIKYAKVVPFKRRA